MERCSLYSVLIESIVSVQSQSRFEVLPRSFSGTRHLGLGPAWRAAQFEEHEGKQLHDLAPCPYLSSGQSTRLRRRMAPRRLVLWGLASTVLAIGTVVHAFRMRSNFYAAAVYLAKSNACTMASPSLAAVSTWTPRKPRGTDRSRYTDPLESRNLSDRPARQSDPGRLPR